jgi:hypothetical protein
MSAFVEVFNHLVLPPQLPGKQDANVESTGDAIIVRLIHAASTLSRLASHEQTSPWYSIRQFLRRCQSLHARGRLEKLSLISAFRNFDQEQPLLLHIAEQNAALIVRYNARYDRCPSTSKQHDPVAEELIYYTIVPKQKLLSSKHSSYRLHLSRCWLLKAPCSAIFPTARRRYHSMSFKSRLSNSHWRNFWKKAAWNR